MKQAFIWLFVINVVFGAVLGLREMQGKAESARMQQQLLPEKIKLLANPPAASASLPPPSSPAPSTPSPEPSVCMKWGRLNAADAPRAQAALASLQLNAKTEKRDDEQVAGYWVYIPPFDSKQEAFATLERMRGLGIADSFLIQDGSKWRNAISLGVFKNEQAAQRHWEDLRRQGVEQAVVGPRVQPRGYAFVIREVSSQQREEIAKKQKDLPDSQLHIVDCG